MDIDRSWSVTVTGIRKTVPPAIRRQLGSTLDRLAMLDHPIADGDVKKLRKTKDYSVRVGLYYRALFTCDNGVINVFDVCHRKDLLR